MAFDVASVKQDKTGFGPTGTRPGTNVPLGDGYAFKPTGGLFRATNLPLTTLISFAYKLSLSQTLVLATQAVKTNGLHWVLGDRWDVEARAQGNPTKDQYRMMVQSLLADRFKFAAHMGIIQGPIYLIELQKPGELGPQLKANSLDSPCSNTSNAKDAPKPAIPCGGMIFTNPNPGRTRCVGRAVPIATIANTLGVNADEKRPVIDKSGLSGTFDFTLEWAPHFNGPLPPGYPEPDPGAPTFLEAIKEQLGLKLDPTTGPISVLVIDHVEEPSAD
ncbi:MAG TPA: TIGR03435 family protein [Candidatus Acidoferrales bacterium]